MRTLLIAIAIGVASTIPTHATRLECDDGLGGSARTPHPIQIVSRGTSEADAQAFADMARRFQAIATRRGFRAPPSKFSLMPGAHLNLLALGNGPVEPHFVGGQRLWEGLSTGRLGTMEFATMGAEVGDCAVCRSFFKANLGIHQNVMIAAHVQGHHHHFATSKFHQQAPADVIATSRLLGERMHEYYREVDHDVVSLYYYYLQAFGMDAMDIVSGIVELPETLTITTDSDRRRVVRSNARPSLGSPSSSSPQNIYQDSTPPWQQTFSVLQALGHFLPANAEPWMRELVRLHELRKRIYPGNFQTKYKNEGLAVWAMYHLTRETEWNDTLSLVEFAQLLGPVIGGTDVRAIKNPNMPFPLTNPYFFGAQGWLRLYEKFIEKHPELQNASADEQVDQFMAQIDPKTHGMNDEEFLRYALDDKWWSDNPIFLARPATEEEVKNARPNQILGKADGYYIVTSRDRERLLRYWSRKLRGSNSMPRIAQLHPELAGGMIAYNHVDDERRPLLPGNVVISLFARSQIYNQPVRLNTWISSVVPGQPVPEGEKPQAHPVTYIVHPNGRLEMQAAGGQSVGGQLVQQLQQLIYQFRDDSLSSFNTDLIQHEDKKIDDLVARIVDHAMQAAANVSNFASGSASALNEFKRMLRNRLNYRIHSGKLKVQANNAGQASIKDLMPLQPHLIFDENYIQALNASKPLAPLDDLGRGRTRYDADDGAQVIMNIGDYLVGDLLPVKGGEPQGGKGAKPQPDKANEQLRDLEIPLEIYSELLSTKLGLPNLRYTDGDIERDMEVRGRAVRRPFGNLLWDRMGSAALVLGNTQRKTDGEDHISTANRDLRLARQIMKEGFGLLDPPNYIVSGRIEVPRPYFDAVLLIGADFTGSMTEERLKMAKTMALNAEAGLAKKYGAGKVKVVYVVFQEEAEELSRNDFYAKFGGGSTSYLAFFKKAREVLARFPYATTNRYMMLLGDGEVYSADELALIDKEIAELSPTLQHMSVVFTNEQGEGAPSTQGFRATLEQVRSRWPWLSIATVANHEGYGQALEIVLPGESWKP